MAAQDSETEILHSTGVIIHLFGIYCELICCVTLMHYAVVAVHETGYLSRQNISSKSSKYRLTPYVTVHLFTINGR